MIEPSTEHRGHLRTIIAASGLFGLFPLSLSPVMITAGRGAGLSEIEAGVWATAMLLGVAASAIVVGALSNRLGARRVLTSGAILVILAQMLSFVAGTATLWLTCLLAFTAGLGFGCGIVVGDLVLARTKNPMAVAGRAMAITSLLMLIVFPIGMALTETVGTSGIALLASTSAVAALIITNGTKLTGLAGGANRQSRPVALGARSLLLLGCVFLFWTRDGMIWSFAAVRAEQMGFDSQSVGLILGAAGACGVVGSALSAWAASTYTLSRGILVLACVPPALAAAAWAQTTSPLTFVSLQLAYNATQLFAYPLLIGIAAQIDGSGRLAAFAGGMTLLGSAAGPVTGAALFSIGGAAALALAVGSIGAISVLAAALAFAWTRTQAPTVHSGPAANALEPTPKSLLEGTSH